MADGMAEAGEEYGASRFGGMAEYMRRKRQKLQNQDAEIRAAAVGKPQIFRGVVAHVNGYTQPSQVDLNRMIVAHGGIFMPVLNQKTSVTHIIASSLTPKKREEFRRYRIVKPSWVTESIKAGRLLPWHQFSVLEQGPAQHLLQVSSQAGQLTPALSAPRSTTKNPFRDQSEASWHTSQMRDTPRKPSVLGLDVVDTTSSPVATHTAHQSPVTAATPPDDIETDESPTSPQTPPPAQVIRPVASDEPDEKSTHLPLSSTQSLPADQSAAAGSHVDSRPAVVSPRKGQSRALTSKDPGFIQQYYQESRLHHLSTWKAQLKAKMQNAARLHSSKLATTAHKRPLGQRRYILHVDFDSFFAAVAMRKDPSLKDKPVAVAHGAGPSSEIASCNYPARSFGVKNGMWMKRATQLCPDLVVVPYDFGGYEETSRQFYDVLLKVPGIIQSVSIDEALVDITQSVLSSVNSTGIGVSEGSIYREQVRADEVAQQIRDEIRRLTGCEVSVGIGGNILQAKVALKKAKPAGQFQLKPEEVMDFIGDLHVQDLPGVAHSMGAKLEELGVKLVRDLRCLTRERLTQALGPKTGDKLFMYARGIDKTEVGEETVRKSISAEINWGIRFANLAEARDFIRKLCGELHRRCEEHEAHGSQLTVRIMRRAADAPLEPPKHMGHGPCDIFNKSIRLAFPTNDPEILSREACQIYRSYNLDSRDIRGVGVQLTKLVPARATGGQQVSARQQLLPFARGADTCTRGAAAAFTTPTKALKCPEPDDPEEIESPLKGTTPVSAGIAERNPALSDPSKKRLNTSGSQFLIPPVEEQEPTIEPVAFHSIPNDILSQLKAQPARKRKASNDLPPSVGATTAVPGEESANDSFVAGGVSEAASIQAGAATSRSVTLPPQTALDESVLAELPEDIRREVLEQYARAHTGSTREPPRPASAGGFKIGSGSKLKPRRVHPAAWARLNKNITLTQSILQTPSAEEEQRLAAAVDKPDPEVLQALPAHIREEIARQTKLKEQQARLGIRRRLNYKQSPPPGPRYVNFPPRPEKPTFTSARLTEPTEIRARISEWVDDFKTDGPYEEDTEILCKYLQQVVLAERDIAKASSLASWFALLVQIQCNGSSTDGSATDSTSHESREGLSSETSSTWRDAVLQVKGAVDKALSERGLAPAKFEA
ncbi:deoxycytidyl transferase [Ascosphaera acerosa]|nr:deoxycytidyl transferase [Ascosphaera acerosa]